MGKSMNPVEAFRREQKKKELKKHRLERQRDKQAKLGAMDPAELRAQLQALERQAAANPADGPTRKRKQELEDTLRAVTKRQKEMAEEERKKRADAPPKSMAELTQANKDKFQNPENSIYYHPTLNPFGAPPPGKPQVYRNMPSAPAGATGAPPRGPPRQAGFNGHPQPRGPPPGPRHDGGFRGRGPPPPPMQQPRAMARRPGKRPPLPSGPPPPGTIQVPPRPPLPSGAIPARPPPPPPANAQAARSTMPPPPPPPAAPRGMPPPPPPPFPVDAAATEVMADHDEMEEEEDSVVAPYPTMDEPDSRTEEELEMGEQAAESRAQLRSLVPVALRVQRQAPAAPISSIAPVPAPRRPVPAPPAPVPRPAMPSMGIPPPPPPSSKRADGSSSVSKEFDAFMDEVKDLL